MYRVYLILLDLISLTLAFFLAFWLRIKSNLFAPSTVPLKAHIPLFIFSLILLVIIFTSLKLYKEKRAYFSASEFSLIFKGLTFIFLILAFIIFLFKLFIYSRLIILFFYISSIFLVSFTRTIFHKRKHKTINVLILGKNKTGSLLQKNIAEHPELAYDLIGFIDDKNNVLGQIKDLPQLTKKHSISIVFITIEPNEQVMDLITSLPIEFRIVPNLIDLLAEPINFDEFKGIPIARIPPPSSKERYLKFKCIFDIIASSLLILVLSPLFIIIYIILSFSGKPIFVQERLGKNKKKFKIYKFRTIKKTSKNFKINKEDPLIKIKNHHDLALFGRFLRRTFLDELPQLFNVLKGDMNLVGPRPHLEEEVGTLNDWKDKRFSVKPGITGLWQISGRHELNFEKAMMLDIYYINHMSFKLDLEILIKTVPSIIFTKPS